jgi:hypothetical protein
MLKTAFMKSFVKTKMHFFYFVLLGFISMNLHSCQNETEDGKNADIGYGYYPLKVGKYAIFHSDSIILRSGGTIRDTVSALIKEEIDGFFVNEAKDTVYSMKVYYKGQKDTAYVYQKTVFVTREKQKITRQEDNLVFTKMVFPMKRGTRFNHNQYFDSRIDINVGGEIFLAMYDGWNTRVEAVNEPLLYANKQVDNIRIRLVDDASTSLEKKVYYETYIKNVGLYSSKMIFLQDNKGGSTPIEDRAIKGFYHERILIDRN